MGDDDRKTPRDRPARRHQTETERISDSLKAKRERDGNQRVRDQVDELAASIEAEDQSDGTPEENAYWDEIDTGVNAVDPGVLEAIRRDPKLRLLYAKNHHERKRRGSAIMEALGEKPPAERMSSFEKTIRRLRGLVIAIAIPAGSSTILIAKYIFAKGAADERARIELEQLKTHDDDYERRIRAVEDIAGKNAQRIDDFVRGRRHDQEPDAAPRRVPAPTTRGTP